MVKKAGTSDYILDPKKTKWIPVEPYLFTKEEWHKARKAAGKK
jgi:hypothetical protein